MRITYKAVHTISVGEHFSGYFLPEYFSERIWQMAMSHHQLSIQLLFQFRTNNLKVRIKLTPPLSNMDTARTKMTVSTCGEQGEERISQHM